MCVSSIHYATLLTLLETPGAPGAEDLVAQTMTAALSHYTDDIKTDELGNLIATVRGEGLGRHPRVLLSAHMDEIALMVSAIEPGGFLRLAQTGGFDARTLVAQEVTVHGQTRLTGIVGSKPTHLTTAAERAQAAPLSELYVDLALPEERVRSLVHIGDRITVLQPPLALLNQRVAGKSLDNRTSLAVELECLDALRSLRHNADVIVVGTVQEEVGVRGAATVGYGINPDIAIAIDVTWADMPGQPSDLSFKMDKGPVIVFGPNVHPKVFAALKRAATEHNIAWQLELSQGPTGTDGRAFQIAQDGIATGVVGIAIRYMHCSVETGSYPDIRDCGKLLAHFIASVDVTMVEELSCY